MDRLKQKRGERFAVYADFFYRVKLKFTPTVTGNNRGQITIPVKLRKCVSAQDEALDSDFITFMTKVMM
jgi:hypothetical protein